MDVKRVLFVCMGNICRSPAGEEVLRHLLAERGLQDQILVDSAGTDAYHVGDPPDPRMRQAAALRGYALTSRARQVRRRDFDEFDLVLAMDRSNLRRLQGMAGRIPSHLLLLSTFLDGEEPIDVPDPFYGEDQGFEEVLDLMEAACPAVLDYVVSL